LLGVGDKFTLERGLKQQISYAPGQRMHTGSLVKVLGASTLFGRCSEHVSTGTGGSVVVVGEVQVY